MVALVVARRSYAMTRGVPASTTRLTVLPILVAFLWVVSEFEAALLSPDGGYLLGLDAAVLVATAAVVKGVAERHVEVYRDARGGWAFRVRFSLAALFLVAFLARTAVAVVLFPSSLEFGSAPVAPATLEQQVVLAVINAFFSFSVGLLIGRSFGIQGKLRLSETAAP